MTADPNWPKGYSTPHGIMVSSKSWEKEGAEGAGWDV